MCFVLFAGWYHVCATAMPYASNDENFRPRWPVICRRMRRTFAAEAFNLAWDEYGGDEGAGVPRCLGGFEPEGIASAAVTGDPSKAGDKHRSVETRH